MPRWVLSLSQPTPLPCECIKSFFYPLLVLILCFPFPVSSWAALFATFQIIGQFTGGYISDRFGLKMSFWNVIFWTYLGVMLEVIAKDWQMWLGSKIVIGFATGLMQSVVPTYVAEVAPRELRGIMLSFFNMASE